MSEKEELIKALKKRALGYEYEETTTLIEETSHGTKKKISKVKKHIPPDPNTARYLLSQLEPTEADFEEILKDFKEEVKKVYGDKENKD